MSVNDLKELLHKQIDLLQDPEDVQDLFLTVSDFVGQRKLWDKESPEFLAKLRRIAESVQTGSATTPNAQVMLEAKQWITK